MMPPGFGGPKTPPPSVQPQPPRPVTPLPPITHPVVPAPAPVAAPPQPTLPPNSIVWDSEKKEKEAKPGDISVPFTFWLTNVSTSEVILNSVRTSCGCTAAKLPSQPWHIPPGSNGPIEVTLNVQGKSGSIVKTVTIDSNAGVKNLLVQVNVPAPQPVAAANPAMAAINVDRMRNMQISQKDRQTTLKGSCATCHVDPARDKIGGPLYATACAICHNAENRATAVPDLQASSKPTDADYYRKFVTEGKPNSMMPAFAKDQGGFLTTEQIDSLVNYLLNDFRKAGKIVYHDPHAAPSATPAAQAPNVQPSVSAPKPAVPGTNAPSAAITPRPTAQVAPGISDAPVQAVR
jgi:mono/diheme cytochrome c family protein